MKPCRIDIPFPNPERLAALVASEAPACWLDSALPEHPRSGPSWVALRPLRTWRIESWGDLPARFLELDRLVSKLKVNSEGLPFCGGLVGFLSYPGEGEAGSPPAAYFLLVDSGIVLDPRRRQAQIFSLGLRDDLSTCDSALARERCQSLQRVLAETADRAPEPLRVRSCRASLDREHYLAKVREVQERILRGDCYQVNFSQRLFLEGEWNSADLYLSLRGASPAPQMAFINLGEAQILSASPEILLEISDGTARSYPIKGTRPRGGDFQADRNLAAELVASGKDAAELLMIVDLVRNDLGRCCETGSIRVPALKALDSLPQVHHLYAIVEGKLRSEFGPLQSLATLFPGGSITGAPKLKAMEIISELEGLPRGIYTGSIGYAGFDGRACFNIAIRTAWLRGPHLEYSAGGGIVADSDPGAEYEESLHKARGLFQALALDPPRL